MKHSAFRPRRLLTVAFALTLVPTGCSSGSDNPELLDAKAAAPLFDDLYEAAKPMIGVAALTPAAEDGDSAALVATDRALERLGTLAQRVVDTVNPADASGALGALERAARDLTLGAGGRQDGPGRVAIRDIVVRLTPDQTARTRKELEDTNSAQVAKEDLRRSLAAAVHRLAYVSLLADPSAQARFAPKVSPSDLPTELPVNRFNPTGGIDPLIDGFESVNEWRDQIFSDGHLVVPNPNADGLAWDAFLAWAQYVNPDLAGAARKLHNAFNGIFLSPVRREP
ncbi:MAG TPA: hypothetical protein VI854_02935 [Acidimicrobiia bacterium]|nr:hypothetical protein [Acidimicrobiia bacterium]